MLTRWNIANFIDSNYVYAPHDHDELTTHLILRGEMTITFPDDEKPTRETYRVGQRVDVEARRKHQVWIGKEGCTMVIGENE